MKHRFDRLVRMLAVAGSGIAFGILPNCIEEEILVWASGFLL